MKNLHNKIFSHKDFLTCSMYLKIVLHIDAIVLCLINCRKLQDDLVLPNTRKLAQNKMFDILVDFDNHLDDIQLDWTNTKINRALPNGQEPL